MTFEPGQAVRLHMHDATQVEGFVHAHDSKAGLVALELIPSADLSLIPVSRVKKVSVPDSIPNSRQWPAKPALDMVRLRADQEKRFRRAEEEFVRIGVGVTPKAQHIFDVISKTLPCAWSGDIIVVLETVRLGPPYDAKSIRFSGTGEDKVADRLKLVLENEARKIRSTADTNGIAP